MDLDRAAQACRTYLETVDHVYGVFLDGTSALASAASRLDQLQHAQLPGLRTTQPELATVEFLDSCDYQYGVGDPNDAQAYVVHRCTQGEYKARNRRGGENWVFLGQVCLVSVYQFWEDQFRDEIATALAVPKDRVKASVFGDLRYLRHSIIHNGGTATSDVDRCEILRWFRRGDRIALEHNHFEELVGQVREATRSFLTRPA